MYDTKLNYVSEYGKELIDLLDPKPGENILDLGCGTGDLAYVISQRGSKVIGMDLSRQMLETARKNTLICNLSSGTRKISPSTNRWMPCSPTPLYIG